MSPQPARRMVGLAWAAPRGTRLGSLAGVSTVVVVDCARCLVSGLTVTLESGVTCGGELKLELNEGMFKRLLSNI